MGQYPCCLSPLSEGVPTAPAGDFNRKDEEMARSARHKRDRKRDIKRGFIPMPRKKNAQNPRIRPYSDMDRDDRMQWWTNGEPV